MGKVVLTLVVGLILAGCATKAPEQVTATPGMNVKVERPVKPVLKPFSERMLVGEIRDVATNDGYRKVQVSVKNLTSESVKTLYRFRWYDDKGIEISAQNHDMWHSIIIVGGDEIVLSASAPEKNCPDVKLLIKEAVKQ